ncbi:MAG TPA: hypothetical protein DHV16_08940 [Nitrospiraceae bacterium]|nr:MAG: hypothetical protein A2Z82_07350 [Nitrospirae bacterium GWA2_46_11]OGW24597.1 MAG: hypothetical protein A2X55_06200 [Nitrospirae bacterium GWB2_47_37]HAK89146.1 hypothetical protein [Nitrospiraceae bacterium]HCZ12357.1 hypothetical protein [Nitrospiraceae bacterium]
MNLYLIDGNSYFYRAFHAIRGLTNSKGFPTNAIYGFTNMIMKIIREKKPDAVAIAFDSPHPTERHRIYEEYKAQRPETPNDLILQIPYIKEIINAFNISSFEMPGYEADDIIGTIAKKAASQGVTVFILSGDKDMMQIVDGGIKIYDPMKDIIIDEKYVIERFGVSPERLPEIMAITGDTVDNIPGVKGIGEKTAKELLSKAGSLDELMDHPEKTTSERLKKMIADNIENIKLSRILATIDTNIPIDISLQDMIIKEPDWPALLPLFTEFEFKSLIKLAPSKGREPRGQYRAITDREDLKRLLGKT